MKLIRLFSVISALFFGSTKGTMNYELISLTQTNLAENVAHALGRPLRMAEWRQFSDGEVNVTLESPERYAGKTAIIVQSTGHPVNAHTLGVAFLAQELKNAGAKKVIAVIPYLGYARQERSAIEGKAGHAQIVAQLFESAGIDELIVVDLHDEKVIDFFSIPVHDLKVESVIADHIKQQNIDFASLCLVAPDSGAAEYVGRVGDKLDVGVLAFSKERFSADQTRIVGLAGECRGTTAIIVDDIIATGGTALNVCNALPDMGFVDIFGYFVHPVLAGNAVARIDASSFTKIFVSNTLPLSENAKQSQKITVFDVSGAIVSELNNIISG